MSYSQAVVSPSTAQTIHALLSLSTYRVSLHFFRSFVLPFIRSLSPSRCFCLCPYIHTHIELDTCNHVQTCKSLYILPHTDPHTRTHARAPTHTHTHTLCAWVYRNSLQMKYIHTYTHTEVHADVLMYTRTCTHTRTYVGYCPCSKIQKAYI